MANVLPVAAFEQHEEQSQLSTSASQSARAIPDWTVPSKKRRKKRKEKRRKAGSSSSSDDEDTNATDSCEAVRGSKPDLHFKLLYADRSDQYPIAVLHMLTNETLVVEKPGNFTALESEGNLTAANAVMAELFEGLGMCERNWYFREGFDTPFTVAEEIKLTRKLRENPDIQLDPGIAGRLLVQECKVFRKAFLTQPAFSNNVGKQALFNLCRLLHYHCVPSPCQLYVVVGNVGGGGNANPWRGDIVIGHVYHRKATTEDQFEEILQESKCLNSRFIRTPDVQVEDANLHHSVLTGEVKRVTKTAGEQQTWEQALAGLQHLELSYGILLTATEAVLFELSIVEPARYPGRYSTKRRLKTTRKVYNFIDDSLNFSVPVLQDLMFDIVGVMCKLGNMFMSENSATSK